jgi:hypothetical protein
VARSRPDRPDRARRLLGRRGLTRCASREARNPAAL